MMANHVTAILAVYVLGEFSRKILPKNCHYSLPYFQFID